MSSRIRQTITILFALLILIIQAAYIYQPVDAAACQTLPTSKGTASTTFAVASAGTYKLWAHVYAPSSGGSAFYLKVDNECPIEVGGGPLTANTFSWIDYANDITTSPITLNLTSGTHTITIAGQDANLGVDQILLLTSNTCIPNGNGNNCEVVTSSASKPTTPTQVSTTPIVKKPIKQKISDVKLIGYIAAGAIIAALIALAILYYAARPNNLLKRIPPFKNRAKSQPQPGNELAPIVVISQTQDFGLLLNRKAVALFVLGFSIVGGLIAFIALAATGYDITISLAKAEVSGQAQIVANVNAISGYMVQFGNGVVASKPTPKNTGASESAHQSSTSPSTGTSPGSGSSSGSPPGPGSGSSPPGPPAPSSNIGCDYQTDTWSGDAASVDYSVKKLSANNGNPASFSVELNAKPGTTEVVGYPSDQCLLYSALPSSLTSAFNITPPAASGGLDYEYAYDIWLTTASAAEAYDWGNDLELMIWTYVNGQVPAGSVKATLADGSKVWVSGNNSTGTVSVVLPSNETNGDVNVSSIVSQLKSMGYITNADNGILDVEYGIEAPYGGGQTFTVDSLSVSE